MNLLGRLLIVLIFIGSIVLASFAVVLYSTRTNWREQHNAVSATLRARTDELAELQRQRNEMEAALRLEIRLQADRNTALTESIRQLTTDNQSARDDVADLRTRLELATTTADSAVKEVEALRIRLDAEAGARRESTTEWVAMSTELIKKMDEAHSLAIQVANLQTTAAQLAKDYRDAVEVLRKHGLSADPELYAQHPPAGIRGVVTEVRPGGHVEISIGQDSGLSRGHQLDVVRDREGRQVYVGRIEITNTVADRAVARVMPEFRRGVVQRGDDVMYIDVHTVVAH